MTVFDSAQPWKTCTSADTLCYVGDRMENKVKLLLLALCLCGCPGPSSEAPCAPTGTYNVVWTRTLGPDTCPTLQNTLVVGANGFDQGQNINACTGACTAANCSVAPVTASSCTASVMASNECGNLGPNRTLTASYTYTGNTAQFVIRDTAAVLTGAADGGTGDTGSPDAGSSGRAECAYSGVGTRLTR